MGIQKWYYRNFKVLSLEKCKEFGLAHQKNVYGDPINHYNCRSFWVDHKGREYRCESLFEYKSFFEWYLDLRGLACFIFGANYAIQIFSLTFSDRYEHYYNKGLTPFEAISDII